MKTNNLTIKQEAFCQAYLETNNIHYALTDSEIECDKQYGNKYYVYFLVNPIDNSIFYIGKGKNKRAENHFKENSRGKISNAKKHDVINKLVDLGLKPTIIVFENELEEAAAYRLETILIIAFKKTISNFSRGFVDKHEKKVQWAKVIQRKIIDFETWVNLKPRTQQQIDVYKSCVEMIENVAEVKEKLYTNITIRDGKLIAS